MLTAVKGSPRRVLICAATLLAGAVVGTALAANSASFPDGTGDNRLAPDIVSFTVSNDDSANVAIRVGIADRVALASGDEIMVGLDIDQNPDTGSVFYGSEYGETTRPASFQASYSGGTATFTIKASDVGLTPTSGFEVYAFSFARGFVDTAPDIRTVNYQMVAGTGHPAVAADKRAPIDEAVKSSGVHGKTVELLYYARDGRGESADTIRVFKGKKVVKTIRFRIENTNPFLRYFAKWKVPKTLKGKFRFCVNSADRAGNKSNTSCAALTIK